MNRSPDSIISPPSTPDLVDRRQWLRNSIKLILSGIASIVAVVVGGAVVSPALTRRKASWTRAGRLRDLEEGVPTAVTVRVTRRDGYYEAVDQQVVFLTKSESGEVAALSSTCTHLGCRVSYDAAAKVFKCPCHGGVYSPEGKVLGGPPPRPLPTVAARVNGTDVFVEL
jgi:Rieske Fe-S protein